jgi:thioredoxin reductase
METKKVVIVGAGPAGIATAMQLKRYGIAPLILERNVIGGLLRNANLVENYPGFPGGISGLKLAELFEAQIRKTGIGILSEEVTRLDHRDRLFVVETENQVFHSHIVVIASGTKHREFTAFDMPEEAQDRILYEIHPILKEKGKKVVIVGAGDAAFDYALNLERNNEVVILNRGEQTRCLLLLREKAEASGAILYKENIKISKIVADSGDTITLECENPEGHLQLFADYVLFAIGRDAQLDYLSKELKESMSGGENGNLYFVGDVKNGDFRQTAIAVGDGIQTAMRIFQRSKEMEL